MHYTVSSLQDLWGYHLTNRNVNMNWHNVTQQLQLGTLHLVLFACCVGFCLLDMEDLYQLTWREFSNSLIKKDQKICWKIWPEKIEKEKKIILMLLIYHYCFTLLCLQRWRSTINNLSCNQLLRCHLLSAFSDPSFCVLLLFLKWAHSAGSVWWFWCQWSCAGNTEQMICYRNF